MENQFVSMVAQTIQLTTESYINGEFFNEEHPRDINGICVNNEPISDALSFFQLLEVREGLNNFINQTKVCFKSQSF